jgi:hypothetical protein
MHLKHQTAEMVIDINQMMFPFTLKCCCRFQKTKIAIATNPQRERERERTTLLQSSCLASSSKDPEPAANPQSQIRPPKKKKKLTSISALWVASRNPCLFSNGQQQQTQQKKQPSHTLSTL